MTYWNYRIIKSTLGGEDWYGIHEVYYDKDGNVDGFTENPVQVSGESPQEIHDILVDMIRSLSEDVLDEEEL